MKRLEILFLTVALGGSTAAAAGPITWVVPSLTRVGQTDTEPTGSLNSITLYSARGQTESFQVIIQAPTGGLTNVNVSASNLTGPGGAMIPSSYQITLYSEHYVTITAASGDASAWGSNKPLYTSGFPVKIPDALVPFLDPVTHAPLSGATYTAVPFSLAAGNNQPIWADIVVPATATPGTYTGTVTVTSAQGSATCSITLIVWHFTLPVTPTLNSSFGFHNNYNNNGLGNQVDNKADEEVLIANRIMPFQIKAADAASLMSEGLNTTGLPIFTTYTTSPLPCDWQSPIPSVASISGSITSYPASLGTYLYAADEIDVCVNSPQFISNLGQLAVNTHAAGGQTLVTATPNAVWFDNGNINTGRSMIDTWVMLPKEYVSAPANIATVVSRGNKIWAYTCLVQDTYSPKWEVDFAPINYRIMPGFDGQVFGFTGILYAGVDDWLPPPNDPWSDVNNADGSVPENGEDILVYPGAQAGVTSVVPSMRLKYIRDGVNDYEYIQMLKNQGQGSWAMGLVNTVVTSWSVWSQNPVTLESVRQQLGAKLDQLAGGGSSPQVTLTKTVDKTTATSGTTLTYTISYKNTGSASAINFVISDVVPVGTTVVTGSISNGGTLSAGKVQWPAMTIAAGASGQVSFQAQVQ